MVGVPMVDGSGDGGGLSTARVGSRAMETAFPARIWTTKVGNDVLRRREADYRRWVWRGASLRQRRERWEAEWRKAPDVESKPTIRIKEKRPPAKTLAKPGASSDGVDGVERLRTDLEDRQGSRRISELARSELMRATGDDVGWVAGKTHDHDVPCSCVLLFLSFLFFFFLVIFGMLPLMKSIFN